MNGTKSKLDNYIFSFCVPYILKKDLRKVKDYSAFWVNNPVFAYVSRTVYMKLESCRKF